MSKGYVYVLTNEHMPGLVKIGKTTRDPESRANELYQTGVPAPFKVEHSVCTPNCHDLEDMMHENFASVRVNDGREFFQCPPREAVRALDRMQLLLLEHWVGEFLPGHCVVNADDSVDIHSIEMLAGEMAEPASVVASAMELLWPEELAPAVIRLYDRLEGKKSQQEEVCK